MSPGQFSEGELVEQPAVALLAELGWRTVNAYEEVLGPGGTLGRDSRRDAVLVHRLRDALGRLNPMSSATAIEEAIAALTRDRSIMDPTRANREIYDLLRDGCLATWRDQAGDEQVERVHYIDWRSPQNNEWLAAQQVWLAGDLYVRRADLLLFVNGIPLVLMEFKGVNRSVRAAFVDNLRDYRSTVPQLFWPNAFVVLSNGSEAKIGATFAPWEHFGEWKKIDVSGTRGRVGLETLIRGTCRHDLFLDLVENFIAYTEVPGGLVKAVARNHQFLGVNAAIEALLEIRSSGEKRLGVFWHTQGSGKTLSMLWFSQKVLRRMPGAWTFVLVTDRKELDDQLYRRFTDAGAVLRQADVHARNIDHLRELLAADHRYVFTLIQKFQLTKSEREAGSIMPVLSERRDVIVMTDEAHRTQYDELALNMRTGLPNAAFMGFTGTPLVIGEELTRREFGNYVSIYNFSDSIIDGATVPLYYENRIPELQLTNAAFGDELDELLEEAEVNDDAEALLIRRFGREYALITRQQRLRRVARDLVRHFANRGFPGKAMYVGIDKATALRMHDLVREEWASYLAELIMERDTLPELERGWIDQQIELMETTDMAVVVSQSQNEVADLAKKGLDIRPHRRRMLTEPLDAKFKDPDDPFRLVFVCAMWMTGFDAPSCSTIYLDRPMRNHTLMQTIARANRVFPDKENGLIVDYIGVFRNLQQALAIYGASVGDEVVDSPILDKGVLVADLAAAIEACTQLCEQYDVDLDQLRTATGFEFIALRDSAVEALLIDDQVREEFIHLARQARRLFKAVLPDPMASVYRATVAVIRVLYERITELSRGRRADITDVGDAVDALLDRSIGAEEYIVRAAAEGVDPDPLIDLSKIDFDSLAAEFAGRKHAETERYSATLRDRAVSAARRNPSRHELVQRIETLISEYNRGSVNIDEYLRRLISLSQDLSNEERRAAAEGLTEEELAIFDLLTMPDPTLTAAERERVRAVAKRLLEYIHEKLVLDWRRKAETIADVRITIRAVLDEGLPEDPYPPVIFDEKVNAVFDHLYASYGDEGTSVYDVEAEALVGDRTATAISIEDITSAVVERMRLDAEFASLVATQLRGMTPTFARSIDELLTGAEDDTVEFKATARWDLREQKRNKAMEDEVVKTVAAFLNTNGGTLLIGVADDGTLVGLEYDYANVRPPNGDGFVNWLSGLLTNSVGTAAAMRVRARIVRHSGTDLCRVDVPASSRPTWTKTSKMSRVFFVRMNNTTRVMPEDELPSYLTDRWPGLEDK